uniref:NPHP8 n=2 Tax=Schmidtea mediterranea TaxID=79327 RepID=A0A0H3YJP0_SCHMD|nr:NPHP8 [Schmidtea mediterranea]
MNLQYQAPNTPNSARYKSQDLYSDSNTDLNAVIPKMDLAQERKTISQWTKDYLEDKYLRLQDDHETLKKHARLQELKIKKLGTKLLKITSDAKKNGDITPKTDDFEEFRRKCSILESQNGLLKDKVKLLQSQLLAQGKKASVYDNVPSRIKSGAIERSNSIQNSGRKNNIRVIKPRGELYPLSPRRDESVTGDQSLISLNKVVEDLKYEVHRLQIENEELLKKAYRREDEKLSPEHYKSNLKDNLDMIRVTRDIKEKEIQVNVLHGKYEDLKTKQQYLERNNREMSDEIERLTSRLRSTDDFAGNAEGQIRNVTVLRKRINDLEATNNDFKKEIYLLKESNDKLTNDAFNTERERDWREKEMNYRAKIAQLELTLKRDVSEKGGVLNKLESERDRVDNAEKEMSNLRLRNYELQAQIEELSDKLKFFSKEASLNPQEIEEALMIIQHKRNMVHAQSTPELDFIQKIDKNKDQDLTRKLLECEMNHAETIQELEKTRSLLRTQYKISNDYRQESEKISQRLDEIKKDYEERLTEYARLLDIRAARIHKLEAQLKDIAYGTRNTQIETILEPDLEPLAPEILERGENILEIHIGRVCLTQQAVENIKDKDPFLFGTWDFYDFETQATGVLRGTSSEFDIKAEYLVKIDDFFLNYLYKNTFPFELHQATGAEYVTLAACQMSCKDIFEKSSSQEGSKFSKSNGLKYHCRAKLVGLRENSKDINFGVLEYWIRLKHPMDQVIRQYREKLKAEGYIMGNEMSVVEARRPIDSMNELIIRIIRCKGLKSRQKHLQPSPYIAYKFYDHSHHTSVTIPSSNSPEFHDLRRIPVQMNSDLHQYLKLQNLQIYVLDELDPDESVYLGVATIPLIQLCHNKNISGSFELHDNQHASNGTLEVELTWQHSYMYQDNSFTKPINSVALLPGEEGIKNENQPSRHTAPVKEETKDQPDAADYSKQIPNATPKEIRTPKKKERQKKPNQEVMDSGLMSPPAVQIVKGILKNRENIQPEKSLSESLKDKDVLEALIMPDLQIKDDSPIESTKSALEEDIKPTSSLERSREIKEKLEAAAKKLEKSTIDDTVLTKPNTEESKPISSNKVSQPNTYESEKKKKKQPKKTPSKSTLVNDPASGTNNILSENDDVIVDKKVKKKSPIKPELNPDEIVVEISSVEIADSADLLTDNNIKFIYVEYRLPGISLESTETISLQKPSVNQEIKKMNYNFKKTFDVSFNKNYMIRQHIATMLTEEPNKYIVFTLVQEPTADSEADCEDIGTAKVNVKTLLKESRNLENERIPIYSYKNKSVIIGYIIVTIQILGVLRAIEKELKT